MGQHQKRVKNLETDRGHGEEIDGGQLLDMILEEGTPGLSGWFVEAQHVFADAALSDVDAEPEQFAMDAGCTPHPGFSRHILRMRARTSCEMTGRPGWPRRTFQVQNNRKPARCQAMTVSGLTITSVERQSRQRRDRPSTTGGPRGLISGALLRTSE